jgi:2-oxoglutarate ferredoxin oxidoreductase subunit alpha
MAFPFNQMVEDFIENREKIFVIEQNRDAQFRSLLINELEINPKKLIKILNYDGMPITADTIKNQIIEKYPLSEQEGKTQTSS